MINSLSHTAKEMLEASGKYILKLAKAGTVYKNI